MTIEADVSGLCVETPRGIVVEAMHLRNFDVKKNIDRRLGTKQ
jgi:hypothetical protein